MTRATGSSQSASAGEGGGEGNANPSQSAKSTAPGVLVRLKGASSFESHAQERGRGKAAARAAALAQRTSLRGQHGRIIRNLVQKTGGLAARRGRGKVVGPSYDEFFGALNAVALHGIDKDAAARLLEDEKDVLSIEPIVEFQASLLQSVPLIDADDLWSMADANGLAIDGGGMRIGIVDTGVDYKHADLGGCFGPGCKVAGGYDFVNDDADPMDDNGHGTHVAATAAGNGTYAGADAGRQSIRGVAPGALIYAYKVLSASGSGYSTDVIAGIERCADPDNDGDPSDHLDVCNLSLVGGGNPDDAVSTAVDNATASGVVFAVAAGNSGPTASTITSPGTARQAITVASACKPSSIGVDPSCNQAIASTSSRGPVVWNNGSGTQTLAKPDVTAPGVVICAAKASAYSGGTNCLDSQHVSMSGTSMATPHVAGVAALLRQAHPEWTPAQVKSVIMTSARNLGFDAYTQGAGEIDALDALTLGGLPQSFAHLAGTPLRDMDVPTSRFATFTSNLAITNTSAQALTFTTSFAGDNGLAVTFAPTSLSLDPGATGAIAVTRQVDHDVVASGTEARGTIVLSTALGLARVGVQVGVRDRLVASPTIVDVGVDLASQTTWTGQATVQLTNTRLDAPATYTPSASCCNSTYQKGGSDITATFDQTSVTVPAGGTATLGLTVQANNAPFSNGRFDGHITLTSPLGTVTVPVTFFKGYGIQIVTTPTPPSNMALSSAQSGASMIYSVQSSSTTFLSTTPGPFFAEAMWYGPNTYSSTHVLAGNIATDVPMRTVTLDRAQATHTFEIRPIDEAGNKVPSASVEYRFTHSASGGGFTAGDSGSVKILTSAIPEGINFTGVAMSKSLDLLAYFYELPGPYDADHLFTNTPDELVTKELRLFRPASPGTSPLLIPNLCFMGPYHSLANGSLAGGGMSCIVIGSGISLPSGVGHMRFYNSSNRDLTTATYPDAPSIQFDLHDGSLRGATLYSGPHLNVGAAHTYLWNTILPFGNTVRVDQVYAHFLCDEPPGDVLPIGPGPLVGQWAWYNHRNDELVFRALKAYRINPFGWGGCWQDYISAYATATTYRLYRDDVLVASGELALPWLQPPVGTGLHRLEVTRDAVIAGVTTTVESVSTFTVSASSSIDENPPAMRSLHLLGHGLWQDVLDPAIAGRLQFVLDPMPGFIDWSSAPPPEFTTMADSLASVRVQQSNDGNAWIDVATTATGNGAYLTDELDISPSVPLTWFRLSASDSAGNTLRHTFQIPRGTGYAPASSDTTAPTTAIVSPTDGASLSSTVTVTAVAADDVGVTRVDLYLDDAKIGSSAAAPYAFNWDTGAVPQGAHVLTTRAHDAAGNIGYSPPVSVTISDNIPPTVAFASPAGGAAVRQTVTLQATATDDHAVARVDFYDGTNLIGTATSVPYQVTWNTAVVADGLHALRAVAFDVAGNSATASIQVTVDNTAPTVAITAPANGATVRGTVTVAATASDAVALARVDFYDGNNLIGSATSAPYQATWNTAVVADGLHALRAVAFDVAGNSANASIQVTVDNTAPTVAITAPANGATVGGTVTVAAMASDAVALARVDFYDGTNLIGSATSAPFAIAWNTIPLPMGLHVLKARAFDSAGNSGDSATVSVTVSNDLTPPSVAITSPTEGAVVTGAISFNATGTDNVGVTHVQLFCDSALQVDSSGQTVSYAWSTSGFAEGSHTLTARAFDAAGNSALSAPVHVTIDRTPPVVAITAPLPGAVVTGVVSVSATASDVKGLMKVELYETGTLLGTATNPPYTFTWNSYAVADGSHTLTARATDLAGNIAEAGVTVTVNNSVTVSLTSPSPGAWISGPVPVTATTSNDGAVASITFYDGTSAIRTVTAAPFTVTWTPTTVGTHSLTAKATDRRGRVTTSPAVSVKVDLAAPTVALTAPANGATVSGTVTVSATASDDTGVTKVEFYRDGNVLLSADTTSPYSITWNTATVPAGTHTLTAVAYDAAGHAKTSASRNVTVRDTTAPTVTITYPTSGSRVPAGRAVTIQATASDASPITRVEFYVSGSLKCTDTTAPYSCAWSVPTGTNRSYTLQAKAVDSSGNTGTSPNVTVTSQ